MGKVVFDISISLDGFITAANPRPEEPMGDGGQRLHEWAFGDEDERNRKVLEGGIAGVGAVIAGRKTYNTSVPWWGSDGPTGSARRPVFVITHDVPADAPQGGVYTFVTDGIESALEQAKAVAGDKDVTVMGGASIGQQYIVAGLIEYLGGEHIHLETIEMIETSAATHLRFRIVK
jgi:dihydrofolate reductase